MTSGLCLAKPDAIRCVCLIYFHLLRHHPFEQNTLNSDTTLTILTHRKVRTRGRVGSACFRVCIVGSSLVVTALLNFRTLIFLCNNKNNSRVMEL